MGLKEELVSVIVPVYKVEKYLSKCIESIINQTYKSLEIILIDDGSPDNCGNICDEYAKKDNRIRVIHKQNGGLSDARNAGIVASSGEYLMFIDSDDYIHPEMILKLYKRLIKDGSDMALCGFSYVDENGEGIDKMNQKSPIKDEVLNKTEFFNKALKASGCWYYVIACNKLYKKEIFNNIKFPLGKIHEDEFIIHKIIDKCDKISCVSDNLYYYVQRTGSIMNTKYDIKRLDIIDAYIQRIEYFIKNKMTEFIGCTVSNTISAFCTGYNNLGFVDKNNTMRISELLYKFKKLYFKLMISPISLKDKAHLTVFMISPRIDDLFMRVYKNSIKRG